MTDELQDLRWRLANEIRKNDQAQERINDLIEMNTDLSARIRALDDQLYETRSALAAYAPGYTTDV